MQVFSDFKFNKNFGQNFISDKNLLNAIAKGSGISSNDEVLEIGTGAGTLTEAIARLAKKVVTYEIDKKLTEFLTEKFKNSPNIELHIADALKEKITDIEKNFEGNYHIIANLPYYITTPLIFKFLEETTRVKSITIMVQKEVAEKIISKVGDPNYGILPVMLGYYAECEILRIVKKQMFTPRPKVDSAVVKITRKEGVVYEKKFKDFVFSLFGMKRKTLVNNLLHKGFNKEKVLDALQNSNISETARSEELSLDKIRQIYNKLVK